MPLEPAPRASHWTVGRTLLVALVLFALLVPCIAATVVVLVLLRERPGPFAGESTVHLTLTAEGARAEADAATMRQRLDAMGVDATVRAVGAGTIEVELRDVGSYDEVGRALRRRGVFGIHAEDHPSRALTPDAVPELAGADVEHAEDGPRWVAESADALAPLAARAPSGRVMGVLCNPSVDGAGREFSACHPLLLVTPAALTNRDVAGATAIEDELSGSAVVRVELTASGAIRFADLSAANVRRRVAFVVDGRVLMAPAVMERIAGGVLHVTLGGSPDPVARLAEAHGLAAALGSRALSREWTLAAVN